MIVVISHGDYASGAVNALQMITGDSQTKAVGMYEDVESFEKEIEVIVKQQDVIFFADLVGGHPFNTALTKSLTIKDHNVAIVGGFNLGLLIETSMLVQSGDIKAAYDHLNQMDDYNIKMVHNWE